jgi:hypothetical protein
MPWAAPVMIVTLSFSRMLPRQTVANLLEWNLALLS